MNDDGFKQLILELIEKDVDGIVKSFVPLYLKWFYERASEYRSKADDDLATEATMNLLSISFVTITQSCVENVIEGFCSCEDKIKAINSTHDKFNLIFNLMKEKLTNKDY